MTDLLAVLDAAIALIDAGTSRSSRSDGYREPIAGTHMLLGKKEVPVVPAIPAAKRDIMHDTTRTTTIIGDEPNGEESASGSIPSQITGSTGTTGSREQFSGLSCSRNFISYGNDGNGEVWPEQDIAHPAPKENRPPVHHVPQICETSPEAFRCSSSMEEIEQTIITLRMPKAHTSRLHRLLLNDGCVNPAAPELINGDLVAQLKAYQAEVVDVRRQPCCGECQEPITAGVTDWLGGLPVHHLCGITAWRREWWRDQRRDDDDEN